MAGLQYDRSPVLIHVTTFPSSILMAIRANDIALGDLGGYSFDLVSHQVYLTYVVQFIPNMVEFHDPVVVNNSAIGTRDHLGLADKVNCALPFSGIGSNLTDPAMFN